MTAYDCSPMTASANPHRIHRATAVSDATRGLLTWQGLARTSGQGLGDLVAPGALCPECLATYTRGWDGPIEAVSVESNGKSVQW